MDAIDRHYRPFAAFDRPPAPPRRAPSAPPTPTASSPAVEVDHSADNKELLVEVVLNHRSVADVRRVQNARDHAPGSTQSQNSSRAQADEESLSLTVSVEHQEIDVAVATAQSDETGTSVAAAAIHLESTSVTVQVQRTRIQKADPLILDLDGDGVELTTAADGARYDLTGDGRAEQAATVRPDDGFLVLDRNGDGVISPGQEFFGDQHGAANGFADLARHDDNHDGQIDAQDAVFDQLRIWQDRNQDGTAQAAEVTSLKQHGIVALSLAYEDSQDTVAGNQLAQLGRYRTADGADHALVDAQLNYLA